jgi:hypothetical protein
MKTFLTKLVGLLALYLVFTVPINAQGITFNFANPVITGGGTVFEFDVTAVATTNTQFKQAQIYIDYNPAAFGTNIYPSNVVLTKVSLLATVNHSGSGGDIGSYTLTGANNTGSKLAIQNTWARTDLGGGETGFDLTNTLGTTPQVYAHVAINIQNAAQSSGLSFDDGVSQFDMQQYFFTSGNNQAQYPSVSVGSDLDSPLPVELSSFNAKVKGSNVELAWQTKTEVNNYGFDVERKTAEGIWKKISFVRGNGNSNSPKDYTFIDKNLTGGSMFSYRLKQLDNDGTFIYSDAVEVEVIPNKYELYQNYPNPFNPSTSIKFSLPEDSRVRIDIYNMLGEKVMELVNTDYKAGFHEVQLNTSASGLASGVYIYSIIANNFGAVKKMLLMK